MYSNKSPLRCYIEKNINSANIIYIFRYLSLSTSCIFYIIFSSHNPLKKLVIILLITTASITLNIIYNSCKQNKHYITFTLFVETICISIIIILSEGFNSPFIWYIFNTILVSLVLLKNSLFSQLCLLIYIIAIFIADIFMLYPYGKITISSIGYNTILCLIIIAMFIHILVINYIELIDKNTELKNKSEQLDNANRQIKDSIQCIINLYRTVHVFSIQNSKKEIINQITNFFEQILKIKDFYFIENIFDNNIQNGYSSDDKKLGQEVISYINKHYDSICTNSNILNIKINNITYNIYPVKYGCTIYGLLIFKLYSNKPMEKDSIRFVAELSGILFYKLELEEINNSLIISYEQNRIADEIHDGVLQRLFSISCCIYNLTQHLDKYNIQQMSDELSMVRESLSNAMKDLRKTVYRLSIKKDAENIFLNDIQIYIDELHNLNNVNVNFEFKGDSELLSITYKKAIYRIICESLSNAVRHGHSNNILLKLNISNTETLLEINDNGCGFDYQEIILHQNNGLGLKNIKHLIDSLNGKLSISSTLNQGTLIRIILPININFF